MRREVCRGRSPASTDERPISARRPEFAREPPHGVPLQGSTEIETCSIRSRWSIRMCALRSRVRRERIRASAIRCLHAGHIGRSLIRSNHDTLAQKASYLNCAGCRKARQLSTRFSRDIRSSERPQRGGVDSIGRDIARPAWLRLQSPPRRAALPSPSRTCGRGA